MSSNQISCPVCSKEFSPAVIENHVGKCLFLNESASNECPTSLKDVSPARKLMKLNTTKAKKTDSGVTKRKSSVIESSSVDTDFQIPGISSNANVIIFPCVMGQRAITAERAIVINKNNF